MEKVLTASAAQTQKLGEVLAKEVLTEKKTRKGAHLICLSGDLGSGKTTFVQGLLKGLKIPGSYTSPTFVIMKVYNGKITNHKSQITNKSKVSKLKISAKGGSASSRQNIYHFDAYRVGENDILSLGWKEIIEDENNIIIVEWAERIKKIIPRNALWIKFEWIDKNERELILTKTKS